MISNFLTWVDALKGAKFLALGEATKWEGLLLERGWTGLAIRDSYAYHKGLQIIRGEISLDGWFVKTIEGYWVKSICMKDLYNQFLGDYQAIILNNTGLDRRLWEAGPIHDSLPKLYLLPEDGHNEGVLKQASDMGYDAYDDGEWLLLVRKALVV